MTGPLLPDFQLWSPTSRPLPDEAALAQLGLAPQAAVQQAIAARVAIYQDALHDELRHCREQGPRQVDRGNLTRDQWEREVAGWLALQAGIFQTDAPWEDVVRTLRKRIGIIRNAAPGWIAKGQRTAEWVRVRLEALETLHWLWYEHRNGFTCGSGAASAELARAAWDDETARRAAWRAGHRVAA